METIITTIKDEAQIFLTDYASYNNGTQFEFGHWVQLKNYDTAEELLKYIKDHFKMADKKSPLDEYGSEREEIMITDFEGFPKELYSECMNFNHLYEYFERAEDSYYSTETIEAYSSIGSYSLDNLDQFFTALEESYNGEYNGDEEFAEDYCESMGYIKENEGFPYNHIDWNNVARELMLSYDEADGHYFRQL